MTPRRKLKGAMLSRPMGDGCRHPGLFHRSGPLFNPTCLPGLEYRLTFSFEFSFGSGEGICYCIFIFDLIIHSESPFISAWVIFPVYVITICYPRNADALIESFSTIFYLLPFPPTPYTLDSGHVTDVFL